MSSQLDNIWKGTLPLLKNELSPLAYTTWISAIKPISIDGSTIELGVFDDFIRGILQTKYSNLITNAIKQYTSRDYEIVFTCPSIEKTEQKEETVNTVGTGENHLKFILNPKYTFDTFVTGNSNRFAQAASVAVAETPTHAYNPLFIYGGVGLGKTHLMHAIGHYILQNNSTFKVLYVSSEQFTNELINAIKDNKNESFRKKYREINVILIDDIQFIAGKERVQEEFFHTFNAIYENGGQIIITSDKPPKEIDKLEERLISRFEWGLLADIKPPDLETRIAILRKNADKENLVVSNEIISFIAENIVSNIRELEGALNKVVAYASLTEQEMSIEMAEEALKDILSANLSRDITCESIRDIVARYYDLKPDELKSEKRSKDIVFPRQIAMYLCRNLTELSLPKIGEMFGGRDHTTVMHSCDQIKKAIETNSETRRAVEELTRNITGK